MVLWVVVSSFECEASTRAVFDIYMYSSTEDEEVVYRFLCSFPLLKANVSFPLFDNDGHVTFEAERVEGG